jgi:hypothetical protein
MEQVGRYLDIISLSARLDAFRHSTCVALRERLIWFGAWLVRRLIVFPLTDHAYPNRNCIRDICADPQIDQLRGKPRPSGPGQERGRQSRPRS